MSGGAALLKKKNNKSAAGTRRSKCTPLEPDASRTAARRHSMPPSLCTPHVSSQPTRPHRLFFFFSSRRRHTRLQGDWSSDVCSSDLQVPSDYKIDDGKAGGQIQ